jgi:hypothetical protein
MTDEKTQDEQNTHHEIIDKTSAYKKSIADAKASEAKRKVEEAAARTAAGKNNKGTQTVKVSDFDKPFMKYCTKCGSQVSESDKFCSDCGQSTGQSSNDAPVKADIKIELVNTNTDKAIKAVGDSISSGKKVVKKHKKATVNFLNKALTAIIGIISFIVCFVLVVFIF